MKQYIVTGMSCAACQARVEKAVSHVEGVDSCVVSLLTNSMSVEGDVDPSKVIQAVEDAGYGASVEGEETSLHTQSEKLRKQQEALEDHETPVLKKRLLWSVIFLCALMYITMGHNMLDWPLPQFFRHNHMALGLTQMILAGVVMGINKKFFVSGFTSLVHKAPNMDTLVALGSGVSFVWSVYVLYKITGMYTLGKDTELIMEVYHNQLYFESAAMIPALITIGKLLEAISKGKTTNALKSLLQLAPKTAVIMRNGKETEVDIDEVQKGDTFVVKPGESIPVDGVIVSGETAVNEASLTGESIPVDKKPGDKISAATLNTSGYITATATRVGEDTTLSQIIQLVSEAAGTKAPVAKIADKVSGIFVPSIIGISLVVLAGWLMAGKPFTFALERAITVLVISCPCALGLATPVAIMVGNGVGAKHGILFKTSEALEEAGKVEIIALDKTGTITKGVPEVKEIYVCEDSSKEEVLQIAYGLESKSEHPLARAIVRYAKEENVQQEELTEFKALVGSGVQGNLHGHSVHGGNAKLIRTYATIAENVQATVEKYQDEGKTPLFFEMDGKLKGVIFVADSLKEDSVEAISCMKSMGIEVVMLTGDNERTANAIGKQAKVSTVISSVLPDGKQAHIQQLQKKGKVMMVGDGINDAPALMSADIGVAIGAGTDVAIDSADVVLMQSSLMDAVKAIRLSRKTLKNIHENLFWAFFYNLICIPLAAGLFSYEMNPMIGAAAMSLSSFTVCMNALRLNLVNLNSSKHDTRYTEETELVEPQADTCSEEGTAGISVIKIAGLDSENAQMVLETVQSIPGVKTAEVLKDYCGVQVDFTCGYNIEDIHKAINDCGLVFTGIEKGGQQPMEKTVLVEGMMCSHCEAHVQKALESLDGVEKVICNHEAGTAVMTLSKDVSEADVQKAVEEAGYTFKGIQA